ncbi:M42 family metallopeptidase [Papillibacter cinnamivorans]|uniref:Endoglucanase n=1 Tax=Papillibacter cinnamivorans DSM 12816 TaxID=1122930 RepID=A0A1W1ZRQ0_9FIRM|nr:M42 family metallopeptidase [Papillibacter cinnamivorans]SMC50748.1 endoglucanase [Papillibacter cinnamivorans DSM 12816]
MSIRETILALTAEPGPSGFEGRAAERAAELLGPYMDEVRIDALGNVIGVRRCGKEGAKRLLLDAHLDEIGFLITGWEEGFLRFRTIGGVDARMLPGREITVLAGKPLRGVVISTPPHLTTKETRNKPVPVEELYIDAGLSQESAEIQIPIGTPAVFAGGCRALGEKQLCSRALDDRACFAVLLRALELLQGEALEADLYVMGSVQEETGGRGAITGTFAVNPDLCIAVDVTHGRTPDAPKERTFALGCGAVIGVGPNMNRKMSRDLIALCKDQGIPYAIEPMAGDTGTNGWEMQIVREGIATAILSIPLKYMHSPVETICPDDAEAAAKLIAAYARSLKGGN